MTPLDHSDRQKGRKAMEEALTPADRAYRRLSSGRPRKDIYEKLSPLEAISRLFAEVQRAYRVLREEGVDTNDLEWALRYYVPASDGRAEYMGQKEQRERDSNGHWHERLGTTTEDAIELLQYLSKLGEPLCLGVIWVLIDREDTTPQGWEEADEEPSIFLPTRITWHTRFNSYPWNAGALTTLLEEERKQK